MGPMYSYCQGQYARMCTCYGNEFIGITSSDDDDNGDDDDDDSSATLHVTHLHSQSFRFRPGQPIGSSPPLPPGRVFPQDMP